MRWSSPAPLAVLALLAGCQQASFSNVSEQRPGAPGDGHSGGARPLDGHSAGGHGELAAAVPSRPGGGGGKAVFVETEFDFGQVAQGEKVQHVFKVRNTGEGVLHIKGVRGS